MDHDTPAYTTNFGGPELIFSWLLKSPGGKAELKAQPALASQAAAIKDKENARLIEIVDNLTGKLLGEAVVEVPQEYIGVGGVNRVADLLYVTSDDNRTMVYSLDTARQLRQIFGHVVAADPVSKRICTANRRDEIRRLRLQKASNSPTSPSAVPSASPGSARTEPVSSS